MNNIESVLNIDMLIVPRLLWRWWLNNIAWLIPQSILNRIENPLTVHLIDQELDNNTSLQVILSYIKKKAQNKMVVLQLPLEMVLIKEVTLPLCSKSDLKKIMSFQIEKETPFRVENIVFDICVIHSNRVEKHSLVQLGILQRHDLEDILEGIKKIDLSVARIGVETTDKSLKLVFWTAKISQYLKTFRYFIGRAVIVLALFLISLIVASLVLKNQVLIAQGEIATLRQKAIEHGGNQQITALRSAALEFVAGRRNHKQYRTTLLETIANILPQDSWITNLSIKDDIIAIEGFSKSAARLIAIFEQNALFEGARFVSPVTRLPGREKEQFSLSIRLKEESLEPMVERNL